MRDGADTSVDAKTGDIEVRFEHTEAGYLASVRGVGGKTRSLVDDAPTCDGLADATALALKLALDLQAAQQRAPSTTASAAAPTREGPPPSREATRPRPLGALSLAGVIALGVASPVASGVRAGAAVVIDRRGRWTLGLTGLLLPAQSRAVGDGTVDVSVQGGGIEACGRSRLGRSLLIALCARVEAMRLAGEAHGFDRSESRARALFGGTLLGQARAAVAGPVAVFGEVGAMAPLVRQRFSIDKVGVVYDPPPVAPVAGIGVAVDFE